MKVVLLSVGFVLLQGCLGGLLSRDIDLKARRRPQDASRMARLGSNRRPASPHSLTDFGTGFRSNHWATWRSHYEDDSRLTRREGCEDDPDYDCSYLTSVENYCEDQQVWTTEHCPVSCGYCTPAKAPAPPVCEDDPIYDCNGLASAKDYCRQQEAWTREHCPASCGWCERTTTKPTETTEAPKPTEGTAEPTNKQPAPPEECEDKEGADCADMSEEYCKDYEEDTRKNCPKSCGWCVVPTEESQTTAEQPTKEVVETTKEATEAPTTSTACIEDTNDQCPRWSERGFCVTASAWMKEKCFKSCGYCEEPKTSQRPTEELTTKTTEQAPEPSQKPTQAPTGRPTRADHAQCLSAFNTYRTAYNLPELRWDQELADGAQAWAEVLRSESRLRDDESLDGNVGETLYLDGDAAADATCANAALSWFEQIGLYEQRGFCESPPYKAPPAVFDFVQMMWSGTTKIGVGIDGPFLVARYYPRGNLEGQVARNVRCEAEPIA